MPTKDGRASALPVRAPSRQTAMISHLRIMECDLDADFQQLNDSKFEVSPGQESEAPGG
jgi:hypothetical protein